MKPRKLLLSAIALLSVINLCACNNSSGEKTATSSVTPEPASTISASSEISEASPMESSAENDWKIKHYVDEFGDDTSSRYINYIAEGTFSNSATSSSQLYASIIVNPYGGGDSNTYIEIALFEYGSHRVINTNSLQVRYDIAYKTQSGKTGTIGGSMFGNKDITTGEPTVGDSIFIGAGRSELLKLLKTPQTIKFIITEKDRPVAKYNFTVDTTGFSEVYSQF